MNTDNLTLVVCTACGQVNVCVCGGDVSVCPVCHQDNAVTDEIRIELSR